MIVVYGPDWVVASDGKHVARVGVAGRQAHSLTSSGSVALLLAVARRASIFCEGPLALALDYDNPRYDALLKFYRRIGFRPRQSLLEMQP